MWIARPQREGSVRVGRPPAPTMARCVYRAGRPRPTIAVSKLVQKLYTPNTKLTGFDVF